jgi:2-phospho-L-lactate/phosphoenolpyruvate guanylyltransferase
MSLWVIIPVKPLNRAKSRLAEVLSPEQRSRFAEMLFRRILTVVREVPQVTGTLVISRDTKALAIARELGAKTLQESNPSDLNPALERATEVVRVWGGNAVLVLPADLPFVSKEDIESIAEMGRFGTKVVLATDRDSDGTNAFLMRPAGLIPYTYGKGSFERHAIAAKLAGADVKIYASKNIELDIDVPEDLAAYNHRLEDQDMELLTPFLPDMTA